MSEISAGRYKKCRRRHRLFWLDWISIKDFVLLHLNISMSDNIPNPPTPPTADSTPSHSTYISLLDSSERPDTPALSIPQRATLTWSRTFDTLRQWSFRTLKYTRQLFQERLGHVNRTQDLELEQSVQLLRETKCHYEKILNDARHISIHFAALLRSQRSLSSSLNDIQRLSGSSDDLVDQIVRNSQCQQVLALNGDILLNSIKIFIDKLQTLISKTMEDTLRTVKIYENARIEYDVYRHDYEILLSQNSTDEHIQRQYEHYKQIYERCKADLTVKLKLLDQNRIEVMKQQLIDFHQSIGNYFSVNRQQLHL